MTSHALLPGAVLGVMGGGQLGRMFVHAAQVLGYDTVVLDPDAMAPAMRVSHQQVQAAYDDQAGLDQLAQRCGAVTTEFENVPAAALARLAASVRVSPSAEAVAVCQDRVAEKAHFLRSGVSCAPHVAIASSDDLAAVPADLLPGILKTARMGYDGKGQARVATRDELAAAWRDVGEVPCVLEAMLPLELEISVIVARGSDGTCVHLPVQQNLHRAGVLAVTQVPAPDAPAGLQSQAIHSASRIAASLDYVGVLCVEFFMLRDGSLVVNEMAPRPHNSGHYSLDACDVSQFDLQVRTLAALPLVAPRQHSSAVMLNLLGDLWADREPPWAEVLALPGAHLHLYGKADARPGRKMGHLTVTAPTPLEARDVGLQAAALLGIDAF
ncbi:MAG: purK [Rhizobacter sp.]|nr:purK [Rhizobacter sp.]